MTEWQAKVAAARWAADSCGLPAIAPPMTGKRVTSPRADVVTGVLTAHRDGFGFVVLDGEDQAAPDIYVPEQDLLGAMHGDRVEVRVRGGGRSGRPRGEITKIVERKRTDVVGTLRARGRRMLVVPRDSRLSHAIHVPGDQTHGAVDGQRVVCTITKYATSYGDARGEITEVLGFADEPGVDTKVILRQHGIPEEFPPEVLAAAERAPQQVSAADRKGRLDLRELPMATIDGADAKDLDDAVSLESLSGGGWRLGVHIADVSHYVRPGSALDDEAYERGTSVYLEDMVVPMLPHPLSNNICSLNAQVERLAMSCLMDLSKTGVMRSYEIRPSVIRVDHRMTYDDVFDIVNNPDSPLREEYGEWTAQFEDMDRLAQTLRKKRERRGSIMFEFPEASAAMDEFGAVEDIVLRETNRAHQLIEEFMILANETVGSYLRDQEAPCVYRIHEPPAEDRVERFLDFVASLGYRVTVQHPVEPRDMQAIGTAAQGRPEEKLVDTLMLRAMRQAQYSPHNQGHFGLASVCYCHFTSPIRRYPDLMVHRVLYQLASQGVKAVRERWGRRLGVIAGHCSDRERVATDAERESLKVKQLLFMQERLGDEFEARVTGVQKYGMFVETVHELVSGLVHISDLEDDYYQLVEDQHCLEGKQSQRRYTLGDAVTVQVLKVSVEERELDFHLIPAPVEERPAPKRPPQRKPAPPKRKKPAARKGRPRRRRR